MSDPIAPDTHALLWYLTEDDRLSPAAGPGAALEMHDRIIAATAIIAGATVITKDRQIRAAVRATW